ncbi:DUF2919 family protein [Salmonella enterica]|nr:DUF2919 family protein [Salmonella enterica]EJN1667684.1 DUF2919 family protein [Salmonella enterica]EKJ5694370.1 DUF2919 family protein [Salmonella enterica]
MRNMKEQGTTLHICRPGKAYRAEDYDDEGNLKAPKMLWFVVVWLLLPWWLTAVGAVSGSTPMVAEVLYPTTIDAVVSLVLSLPVMLLCSIYPLRGRYEKVSLLSLGAVYLSQIVEIARLMSVMLRTYTWYTGDVDLVISVLCIYSAGMLWMIVTSRLLMVFGGTERRKCR